MHYKQPVITVEGGGGKGKEREATCFGPVLNFSLPYR